MVWKIPPKQFTNSRWVKVSPTFSSYNSFLKEGQPMINHGYPPLSGAGRLTEAFQPLPDHKSDFHTSNGFFHPIILAKLN